MARILLAIAVLLLMVFIAWRQRQDPPQALGPNAISDQVADALAGTALRAKQTAEDTVEKANQLRQEQIRELDKFQTP